MKHPKKSLRRALGANVLFSTTCATISLAFATPIAQWMGIPDPRILWALGIGLLLFAASIVYLLRQPQLKANAVRSIILQDWLWVIGSALLVATQAFGLSQEGYWLVVLIALEVMALALFQQYFLKHQLRSIG